ncbi:hypothetical protein M758_8G187900 [Ceratodon purpureus]|nr:hypothetical protein M758_8G187900 [Ceratodon purpureus]
MLHLSQPPLYSSFLCTWPTVLASTTLLSDLAAGLELASLQGVRISWQREEGFCADWEVASRIRH